MKILLLAAGEIKFQCSCIESLSSHNNTKGFCSVKRLNRIRPAIEFRQTIILLLGKVFPLLGLQAFISHMGARHTNDKIGRFNLNEVAFFNTDILAHENHQTEIVPERFVEKFILPPQVEALQIPIALVDMR